MAMTLPEQVPSPSGPRTSLSPSEREVLRLFAHGLKEGEIAHRLLITPETVKTHARNGRQRLGARTRAHAVALAIETGEIEL